MYICMNIVSLYRSCRSCGSCRLMSFYIVKWRAPSPRRAALLGVRTAPVFEQDDLGVRTR